MTISAKYSPQGDGNRIRIHYKPGHGDSSVVLRGKRFIADGRGAECDNFDLIRTYPHVQKSGRCQGHHGAPQAVSDQDHLILLVFF